MFLSLSQYSSMHLDETAEEMKQMTEKISCDFIKMLEGTEQRKQPQQHMAKSELHW